MDKKGQFRIPWGALDLISTLIVILGIVVLSKGNDLGWILIILGIIKQFSGR